MSGAVDALTQALAQVLGRAAVELLVALLHDSLILAAAVWVILAAGRVPLIRRIPLLGRALADAEAGARRMFLGHAQRALRTGIAPGTWAGALSSPWSASPPSRPLPVCPPCSL